MARAKECKVYNTIFHHLGFLDRDQTCYVKLTSTVTWSFFQITGSSSKKLQKVLFVTGISQKGLWCIIPLTEITLDTKFQ